MTIYYFSSVTGSDGNAGTSSSEAWQSLSKLSQIRLQPGDQIMLERGSNFDQTLNLTNVSGRADAPIVIGAYGAGDSPILSADNGKGIYAYKANHFVVDGITIADTGDAGIYANYANGWVVRNVTFNNTGGSASVYGSINWRNSSDLLVHNNTMTDSRGDGIFMKDVSSVVVQDNLILNVTGTTSDNIQILGRDIVVAGNVAVVDDSSNTTKGNMVLQGSNIYAHDNYLEGGSFGLSLSANNVVVENNVLKNHDKYSWSSNLMIIDEVSGDHVSNIVINDNEFHDAYRNITIDGFNKTSGTMYVDGLVITNNEFDGYSRAALLLNGTNISGTYIDNSYTKTWGQLAANNSNVSNLEQANNLYADPLLSSPAETETVLNLKTISIKASASLFEGVGAQLKIYVNDTYIGGQEIIAQKGEGQTQLVVFEHVRFDQGDTFSIKFTNDRFNHQTGQDRNLYLHDVNVDGHTMYLSQAERSDKVFFQKADHTLLFSSYATAEFSSEMLPADMFQPTAALNIEDILETGENVAYYGGQEHFIGSLPSSGANEPGPPLSYTLANDELPTLHQVLADNFG